MDVAKDRLMSEAYIYYFIHYLFIIIHLFQFLEVRVRVVVVYGLYSSATVPLTS